MSGDALALVLLGAAAGSLVVYGLSYDVRRWLDDRRWRQVEERARLRLECLRLRECAAEEEAELQQVRSFCEFLSQLAAAGLGQTWLDIRELPQTDEPRLAL